MNGGHEVVEGSDVSRVVEAWKSRDYMHIVYYNHGDKTGNLQYDYGNGLYNFRSPIVIFDPLKGYTDKVSVCCCHSDKVVSQEVITTFAGMRIDFSRVKPPYEGVLIREDAYRLLAKYFDQILKQSGKEACEK
jgi:hypothetical protein